jgi:hypothetical protein
MALLFSGANYLNLGYAPDFAIGDSFTFALWVYRLASASSASILAAQADNTPPEAGDSYIYIRASTTAPYNDVQVSISDVNAKITTVTGAAGSLPLNEWHHIGLVRDVAGDRLRLYVDGAQSGLGSTDASTGSITLTGYPLFLGARNLRGASVDRYGNCICDDLCAWNVALTATELLQLAQSRRRLAPIIQSASLKRWWPLQAVNGAAAIGASSVQDYSANLGHGTPVDSPVYALSTLSWPAKTHYVYAESVITEMWRRTVEPAGAFARSAEPGSTWSRHVEPTVAWT